MPAESESVTPAFIDEDDRAPFFCGFFLMPGQGRRYLIGVAAAVQLAIFPAWLGAATMVGLPPNILNDRLFSFVVNLVTISAATLASFAVLDLRNAANISRVVCPTTSSASPRF
jgi:hypothetical protein